MPRSPRLLRAGWGGARPTAATTPRRRGPHFARAITTRARVGPPRTRGRPGLRRLRPDQSARRHGQIRARQPSPVDSWCGALLVEPGSSRQSGDQAARTRFSGRRPRLRALPASRHRTRIGHRARARCPNLLQRPSWTLCTADRTAESRGSVSATRTAQRPLWQIWTNGAPLGHPQPDSTRPTARTWTRPLATPPHPPRPLRDTTPDTPDATRARQRVADPQRRDPGRARRGHCPDHGAERGRWRTRGARQRSE